MPLSSIPEAACCGFARVTTYPPLPYPDVVHFDWRVADGLFAEVAVTLASIAFVIAAVVFSRDDAGRRERENCLILLVVAAFALIIAGYLYGESAGDAAVQYRLFISLLASIPFAVGAVAMFVALPWLSASTSRRTRGLLQMVSLLVLAIATVAVWLGNATVDASFFGVHVRGTVWIQLALFAAFLLAGVVVRLGFRAKAARGSVAVTLLAIGTAVVVTAMVAIFMSLGFGSGADSLARWVRDIEYVRVGAWALVAVVAPSAFPTLGDILSAARAGPSGSAAHSGVRSDDAASDDGVSDRNLRTMTVTSVGLIILAYLAGKRWGASRRPH